MRCLGAYLSLQVVTGSTGPEPPAAKRTHLTDIASDMPAAETPAAGDSHPMLPDDLLTSICEFSEARVSFLIIIQQPMFIEFISRLSVLGGFSTRLEAIEDFWKYNTAEIEATHGSIPLLKKVALAYLKGYALPCWKYLPGIMRSQYDTLFTPGPVYKVESDVNTLVTFQIPNAEQQYGYASLTIDHHMVSIRVVDNRRFIDNRTGASVDMPNPKYLNSYWIPTLRIFYNPIVSKLINQYGSVSIENNLNMEFRLSPDLGRVYIGTSHCPPSHSVPVDFRGDADKRTERELVKIDGLSYVLGRVNASQPQKGHLSSVIKSSSHSGILGRIISEVMSNAQRIEALPRENVMQGVLKDIKTKLEVEDFFGVWLLIGHLLDRSASINIRRRVADVIEGRVVASRVF